jgi:hypothetical protein
MGPGPPPKQPGMAGVETKEKRDQAMEEAGPPGRVADIINDKSRPAPASTMVMMGKWSALGRLQRTSATGKLPAALILVTRAS